jgi:hypothetical protein
LKNLKRGKKLFLGGGKLPPLEKGKGGVSLKKKKTPRGGEKRGEKNLGGGENFSHLPKKNKRGVFFPPPPPPEKNFSKKKKKVCPFFFFFLGGRKKKKGGVFFL